MPTPAISGSKMAAIRQNITQQDIKAVEGIWQILQSVPDPEIPVLNVLDLGIVRTVAVDQRHVRVSITPTYSGCPATDTIAQDIRKTLVEAGYQDPEIEVVLSPAWTTDWISKEGREKLLAYGIVPPIESSADSSALFSRPVEIPCPRCKSVDTILVSQFGSTPCKALYKCAACLEPFDYFKCLK